MAAWDRVSTTLGDDPAAFNTLLVTCNFFAIYGLERPKLGRLFRPDECSTPGGAPVVVLSEEIWRSRLSADPKIIGREIRLNRQALTVVGVAPARFSGRNYRETKALPSREKSGLGPVNVAFAVRQRTRELGIRIALGAGRLQVVRLVLVSGMKPVLAGLAVGTVLSIGAARVLDRGFASSPIPLSVQDPLAYVGGAALLVLAAIAAMLGPAQRAAATDPIKALRQE